MAAQWGFIFQFALERENDSAKSNVKCPSQYHGSQQNPIMAERTNYQRKPKSTKIR